MSGIRDRQKDILSGIANSGVYSPPSLALPSWRRRRLEELREESDKDDDDETLKESNSDEEDGELRVRKTSDKRVQFSPTFQIRVHARDGEFSDNFESLIDPADGVVDEDKGEAKLACGRSRLFC